MSTKRGFVIVLVLLLLSVVLVLGEVDETGQYISENGFTYTYGIGVSGAGLDDGTCPLGPLRDELSPDEAIVVGEIVSEGFGEGVTTKLDLRYIGHGTDNTPPTFHEEVCEWQNLPLPNEGCYLLAQEYDLEKVKRGNFFVGGSIKSASNECNGWIVESGKIIKAGPSSIASQVFEIDGSYRSYNLDGANSFYRRYSHDDVLKKGTWSFGQDHDAACMLRKDVTLEERSFLCGYNGFVESYTWLSCDKSNEGLIVGLKGETTSLYYECQKNSNNYVWESKEVQCGQDEVLFVEEGIRKIFDCSEICNQKDGDWTDVDGGSCCGASPNDLGRTTSNKEFVCLNKENVGAKEETKAQFSCESGWCWVQASSIDFEIMSLKDKDIVSNNKEWLTCDENNLGGLEPGVLVDNSNIINTNQFYCYQEGDRYAWAECGRDGVEVEDNIRTPKFRKAGDALFTLPFREFNEGDNLEDQSSLNLMTAYKDFYSGGVDFTGYSHLDLFIDFVDQNGQKENLEINYPVDIKLQIFGRDNQIYYDNYVLALADNVAFPLKQDTVHIKIDLPEDGFRNVEGIRLSPTEGNNIIVKKAYLSNDGESLFCSGEPGREPGDSSWINSLDDAEVACKNSFGGNAWQEGQCCGNIDQETFVAEGAENACWKSLSLSEGDTVMDVEFEVGYEVKEQRLELVKEHQEVEFCVSLVYSNPENGNDIVNKEECVSYNTITERISPFRLFSTTISMPDSEVSSTLSSATLPFLNNEEVDLFWEVEGEPFGLNLGPSEMSLVNQNKVRLALIAKEKLSNVGSSNLRKTSPFTFSCSFSECTFPLPGEPGESGYTINYDHQGLYDLYFVNEEGEETRITPNKNVFFTKGNIRAKKLPQQIIYSLTEDEQGFYSCNAADYVKNEQVQDISFCSIKEGQFCSPQDLTTGSVSTWSVEQLSLVGYEPTTDLNDLRTKPAEISAENRNHSSVAVPGRNFLPNAEFNVFNSQDLESWDLFGIEDERRYPGLDSDQGMITLSNNDLLISERIAVEKNVPLHFSQDFSCPTTINFYDHNGQLVDTLTLTETEREQTQRELDREEQVDLQLREGFFDSGEASFLTLTFQGNCQVKRPMLQRTDNLAVADYSYGVQYPTQRTGIACCQQGACWNGYVCVEEMSETTFLSEHVDENRDYRCVEGQWQQVSRKKDWNNQAEGFCQLPTQCFVINSGLGDSRITAQEFLANENSPFPTCINKGEFILDNYCEDGEWSSRTKLLADKLVEVVENEDFTLYCTNYQEALVDSQSQVGFLGGIFFGENEQNIFGQQETPLATCFNRNDEAWESLVPTEKNTCVNNICVVKYRDGKIALATSLNKPINSEEGSFLQALGLSETECVEGEGFTNCQGNILWYNGQIESVIFNKAGINLNPNFVERVWEWLRGLFANERTSEIQSFIQDAGNFRDVYILKQGDKLVKAVQELRNVKDLEGTDVSKNALIAEYEGFTTPICKYIENSNLYVRGELLDQVEGRLKLSCSEEEGVQHIEAEENIKQLWPQLTGKLRVS